VLSPVVPWISRVLARAFAVCLAVPFVWAVCFAASGAMLNDGLLLKGSSGFFDALLEPLAAIALLWMMLWLPGRLAQMAMLGAHSVRGGFVSRAASYAAGSQMRETARQHLPAWAGGRGAGDQRSGGADSRLGSRLSAESVLAASKAASAGAASAGVGAAGAASAGVGGAAAGVAAAGRVGGNGKPGSADGAGSGWLKRARSGGSARAYSPPPLASSQGAVAASGGLQRPSWRQDHFDAEMLEASLREQRQPVSGEQARRALDALPVSTQGAVGSLVGDHGARARQHLAYQALGEWTPDQREAIRTLAAATPEVRAQAFADGGGSRSGFGESADPKPRTAGPRAEQSASGPAGTAGNGATATRVRQPQDQPRPDDRGGS
jgi:hypothetical protein